MEYRPLNEEVLYPSTKFVGLSAEDLKFLKAGAAKNLRQRLRLCTHQNPEEKVHEMFIVHGQDTYVRPHRHVNKTESFFLIEGEADAVFFDEQGKITKRLKMGDAASGQTFYYRITDPVYHSLIIKSPSITFFEVTQGPFKPEDTQFPAWAPDGKDKAAADAYRQQLAKEAACV